MLGLFFGICSLEVIYCTIHVSHFRNLFLSTNVRRTAVRSYLQKLGTKLVTTCTVKFPSLLDMDHDVGVCVFPLTAGLWKLELNVHRGHPWWTDHSDKSGPEDCKQKKKKGKDLRVLSAQKNLFFWPCGIWTKKSDELWWTCLHGLDACIETGLVTLECPVSLCPHLYRQCKVASYPNCWD